MVQVHGERLRGHVPCAPPGTRRDRDIVKFDGGYHGHHDLGSWSFEWTPSTPPSPAPESVGIQEGLEDDIVALPFNDPEAVTALLAAEPTRFAAVILEPSSGPSPRPEFLRAVREACTRTGTVLIFDEIVTGFRCAPAEHESMGVTPDLTTLGKALGGGVPIAALAGRRSLMEHLDPSRGREARSFHCGTFNGYLLGVEAAHATLDLLVEGGGIAELDRLSRRAGDALRRAFADVGVPVVVLDGCGLFQHYFGEGPIRRASDVRATDHDALVRWHHELLALGVYKLEAKGYVSLAHEDRHFEALEEMASEASGGPGPTDRCRLGGCEGSFRSASLNPVVSVSGEAIARVPGTTIVSLGSNDAHEECLPVGLALVAEVVHLQRVAAVEVPGPEREALPTVAPQRDLTFQE